MSRKIKIIFTVSILLNVFLFGLMVGSHSKTFSHKSRQGAEKHQNLTEFIRILPESERSYFQGRIESLIENNRETRRQIRKTRREIRAIFAQEPFDADLYYQKTREMHDLRGTQMVEGSRLVGEISAHLPRELRMQLAERLRPVPVRFNKHMDREQKK